MNREGKNGYLTLETKRRLKSEAQVSTSIGQLPPLLFVLFFSSNHPKALKEEAAGEGSASPSKTDNKKRGFVKDDPDVEGAAEDEPPAKKTKARTKREPKIKNEDADGGSENEEPATKKTKTRTKKEPKIKNEDTDGGSENEDPTTKKTKARTKKEPKVKTEDADGGYENEGPTTKKTKPSGKKGRRIKNKIADGASENEGPANKKTKAAEKKAKKSEADSQDVQPIKKGRKRAKKATAGDEDALHVKDESSDHDALPTPIAKKTTRIPRKAATDKKIKDEDTESDDLDPTSELEAPIDNFKAVHTSEPVDEASEDAPKLQRGRKRAQKKAIDGPAEETKKVVKHKVIPLPPLTD